MEFDCKWKEKFVDREVSWYNICYFGLKRSGNVNMVVEMERLKSRGGVVIFL